MNPPLSDCCNAEAEGSVSSYNGYGRCSRCKCIGVFPDALNRTYEEDKSGNPAAGILWGIFFTVLLFTVVAFPRLPGWAVGLAAIVCAVFGLAGWRLNKKEIL